jgi:UDP-N-acetylglucosamine--N-acetylmuramyl-(pentapeptide) pyrophosphoryl-undecaprenol N-acetylglucosamine transferase
MPQPGCSPASLAELLEALLGAPERLSAAAGAAAALARPDAARRLADLVLSLTRVQAHPETR